MTLEILPDEMVEVRRVEVFKLSESLEGNGSFPNRMILTGQIRLRTAIRENVESISWVFQMELKRIYGERPYGDGQLLSRVNHIITIYES